MPLWHGWLPGLTSRSSGSPKAVASCDLASHNLEKVLGPYPLSTHSAWHPFWDQDDAQDMVDDVPVAPNIWTDGSREPIPHLDVEVAGAGAFVLSPAIFFDCNQWRYRELSIGVLFLPCKRIRGSLFGINNSNVLRGVAKLLSQGVTGTPLPLVKDGDLLATIHSMLCLRGMDTVTVSKVKGHATQAMVDNGDVRIEDLIGNNGADAAADLGRLRQQDDVITARRDLLRVLSPLVLHST